MKNISENIYFPMTDPVKVRRACLDYPANKAGLASPELSVSAARTARLV